MKHIMIVLAAVVATAPLVACGVGLPTPAVDLPAQEVWPTATPTATPTPTPAPVQTANSATHWAMANFGAIVSDARVQALLEKHGATPFKAHVGNRRIRRLQFLLWAGCPVRFRRRCAVEPGQRLRARRRRRNDAAVSQFPLRAYGGCDNFGSAGSAGRGLPSGAVRQIECCGAEHRTWNAYHLRGGSARGGSAIAAVGGRGEHQGLWHGSVRKRAELGPAVGRKP